jgi:two-component system cell cycle response regulator DivK
MMHSVNGREDRLEQTFSMESSHSPKSPSQQGPNQPKLQPASAKKILVADDIKMNRELMRDVLESNGYLVMEARDGGEAIREAYSGQPDLILLDIDMPVLNGFAVVRRLRQDKHFGEIPIIAITGLSSREDRERAYDSGFNSFLRKPFNLSNMLAEIECFLGVETPGRTVRAHSA